MEQQESVNTGTASSEAPSQSYVQAMVSGPASLDSDTASDAASTLAAVMPETAPTSEETTPDGTTVVDGATATKPETTDTALAPDTSTFPPEVVTAKIEELRLKFGLGDNPINNAALKKMAHQELQLDRVQAENATLRSKITQPPGDGLTEYERRIQGIQPTQQQQQQTQPGQAPPGTPPQPPAPPLPPPPGQRAPIRYGDIGDNWTSALDAINAEQAAWETGKPEAVLAVKNAVFLRQFDSQRPIIEAMARQIAKSEADRIVQEYKLNEVVPTVRQTMEAQQRQEMQDFAVNELSRSPGFEDVGQMFEVVDGPKIPWTDPKTGQTQLYDDCPLSRILIENPEILDIQATHPDPKEAHRLTSVRRLRLAAKAWKAKQASISPDAAKQLVDAGAAMASRKAGDAVRQGINAGPSATGLGAKADQSYTQSMLNLPGSMSVSDLLRTK